MLGDRPFNHPPSTQPFDGNETKVSNELHHSISALENRLMVQFTRQEAMLLKLMHQHGMPGEQSPLRDSGKQDLGRQITQEPGDEHIKDQSELWIECGKDEQESEEAEQEEEISIEETERQYKMLANSQRPSRLHKEEIDTEIVAESPPRLMRLRLSVKQLVLRKEVEFFFLLLILSNAVLFGMEIETSNLQGLEDIPSIFEELNVVFTALFVLEMFLKLVGFGCWETFAGSDWRWNFFDMFIVLSAIVDVGVSAVQSLQNQSQSDAVDGVSMSHFRVLRILRVARVLRGMRVLRILRFISSLRALLLSILITLKSLVWTMLLILVLTFSLGSAFTSLVSEHCRSEAILRTGSRNAIPECLNPELSLFWGSLGQSMYTLFMSITGGLDWQHAAASLEAVSIVLTAGFNLYISFMFFAVLNVITGIVCQTAIESANADKDLAVLLQMQNQKRYAAMIRQIFKEIDRDGSDEITLDEFEEHLKDERLSAFFHSVDIDVSDAWTLFSLIDGDRSGCIDIEEFVAGCIQLKGPAKAVHIAKIGYEQRVLRQLIKELEHTMVSWGKGMKLT
eukprot:TRINITY_DN20213_c0_g1_i1.p1 TRINITY_DN20213_c0_g1~~TRINITY_DN20213_c0_g1_i1.p1  ORF type:complete len:566 (+),score=91.69 TRINITY_DN20213_c0_g1_i1:115-1812(+)